MGMGLNDKGREKHTIVVEKCITSLELKMILENYYIQKNKMEEVKREVCEREREKEVGGKGERKI